MQEEQDDAEIVYLELEDVLEFYAATIGGSVDQARDHLRDPAGLERALARPASHAHYEGADPDWILSFSVGTSPAQLAERIRPALAPIG